MIFLILFSGSILYVKAKTKPFSTDGCIMQNSTLNATSNQLFISSSMSVNSTTPDSFNHTSNDK